MRIKLLILVFFTFVIYNTAIAQFSTGLSLSGGINYIKMSELGGDEFSEFLPGLTYKTGVLLRKNFSDKFSVEIEPAFLIREVKWVLYPPHDPDLEYLQKYRHSYVSIPILADLNLFKNFDIKGGVVNNIFIDDKTIANIQASVANDYDVKSNPHNLAFAVGFEYTIFEKLKLELNYEIDYLDSYKAIHKQTSNVYYTNHAVFFSVAYILFTTNDEE